MLRRLSHFAVSFAGLNAAGLAAFTVLVWRLAPKGFELIQLAYITILANVYICVVPHEPLLLYYGKICGYWGASVVSAYGAFAAGVIDYETLRPFFRHDRVRKLYADRPSYKIGVRWFYKMPFLVMFLAALTPAPLFPFKFMAFSSGYGKYRYLAAVTLGRFPRYLLYTWVADRWNIPNWAIIALVLLTAAAAGWGFLRAKWKSRQANENADETPPEISETYDESAPTQSRQKQDSAGA